MREDGKRKREEGWFKWHVSLLSGRESARVGGKESQASQSMSVKWEEQVKETGTTKFFFSIKKEKEIKKKRKKKKRKKKEIKEGRKEKKKLIRCQRPTHTCTLDADATHEWNENGREHADPTNPTSPTND